MSAPSQRPRWIPAIVSCAAVIALLGAFVDEARGAGSLTITTCGKGVFVRHVVTGIRTFFFCPPGTNEPPGMTVTTGPKAISRGDRGSFQADAPAGLAITGASIGSKQLYSLYLNNGGPWGGGFYWAGGGAETYDTTSQYFVSGLNTPYFGFQLVCGASTCDGSTHTAQITVESIHLYATETQGPSLSAPDGLWQATGWVRGVWTLHFWGDSPSGICSLSASLNGQAIPGTTSSVDPSVWHQCAAPPVSQSIQTGAFGEGAAPLTIRGVDAAGVSTPDGTYTKIIYIDNSHPVVSFAGSPSDAATTAGTQYVMVSAGGSPSGIAGLSCSVDGGPTQWTPGSSASVPVSGIGQHSVKCSAADNAVDGAGNAGWSDPATWLLSIRQPTVQAVGFMKVLHPLRCRAIRELVTLPPRWVTVHRHHKLVRLRRRRTKLVRVTKCRPQIVQRRITVWHTIVRKGKKVRIKRKQTVRVAVPPRTVLKSTRRVGHGKHARIEGWLGMPDGTALAGQPVRILTAPDNNVGKFKRVGTATTARDGTWKATLPAGPSRLVEATFPGTGTLEPSSSDQVREVVPAKVRLLRVWPRSVPWSTPGHPSTVHIRGQLKGGYLPPGGALVRLRIGEGKSYTTYGVQEHVTGRGRFSTTYTFGDGLPSIRRTLWFQIASLPMGNYPWAPGASNRRTVVVGGHR